MGASFAGMLAGGQKVGLFQTHIPPPGLSIPCFLLFFFVSFFSGTRPRKKLSSYTTLTASWKERSLAERSLRRRCKDCSNVRLDADSMVYVDGWCGGEKETRTQVESEQSEPKRRLLHKARCNGQASTSSPKFFMCRALFAVPGLSGQSQ
jgi:hypothetical protein